MKILFVNYRSYDNLVAHRELAAGLSELGCHVDCYTTGDDTFMADRGVGVIVHPDTGPASLWHRLRFFAAAADRAHAGRYDRVIVCYMHGCFACGWRIDRLRRADPAWKPLSYFDLRSGSVSGVLDWLQNRLFAWQGRAFDHRFVICEALRAELYGPGDRESSVLGIAAPAPVARPSTTQRAALRARYQLPENSFVLLYAGTFAHRRLDEFITGLTFDEPRFRLVLLGRGRTGDVERIVAAARKRGGSAVLRLPGQVPYEALDDYLRLADAGLCYVPVIRRFTDQPPVKLLQYLAYGLPVVTTRTRYVDGLWPRYADGLIDCTGPRSVSALMDMCSQSAALLERQPLALDSWEELTRELRDRLVEPRGADGCYQG